MFHNLYKTHKQKQLISLSSTLNLNLNSDYNLQVSIYVSIYYKILPEQQQ